MIVVSYIGTGKTSTCRNVNKYIDLNVNLFKENKSEIPLALDGGMNGF